MHTPYVAHLGENLATFQKCGAGADTERQTADTTVVGVLPSRTRSPGVGVTSSPVRGESSGSTNGTSHLSVNASCRHDAAVEGEVGDREWAAFAEP